MGNATLMTESRQLIDVAPKTVMIGFGDANWCSQCRGEHAYGTC